MIHLGNNVLRYFFPTVFVARRLYRKIVRPIRVGVRALIVHEHQVLLVRHHSQPFWVLPGGLAKRGEALRTVAVREVREETGCSVEVERLLGVYSKMHEGMTLHTAVFVCLPLSPLGKGFNIEIAEAHYWHIDALPDTEGMIEDRLVEYMAGAQGLAHGF